MSLWESEVKGISALGARSVLFLVISLCYSSADFDEGLIHPDITMGLGWGERDQCPLSSLTPIHPEAGDVPVSLEV